MNVHHTLICFFFFTVLQDGNIGLINAEIPIFRETEGQNITVQCYFTTTGSKKYFCKDEYEENYYESYDYDECQRILEMDGVSQQSGRYSMRYETTNTGSRLDVTITHLNKSDSGVYGCGLDKFFIDPYQEFEIIVTDAPSTSKPKLTLRPSSTSLPSASTKTTTTTTTTTSPKTTNQSEQEQTRTTTAGGSGVLLYVGLTLVLITVLLSSVAVLILCKKRACKLQEHPEETEYVNVTEASRVYNDVREGEGQSRSPPVENSVQTSVVYSVVTAAASRPLSKTEDDWSEVVYTRVDFSNRADASLSSAPCGHVIYSAPRKRTNARIVSQSLDSTVSTSPQQ